jgi:uncharacterized SAM-binding protein YcdF (DUF218 family)
MSITRLQRIVAVVLVLVLFTGALFAGRVVTREDPLQHADAIYVLGGSWVERWLEAADLYNEHYAPNIVISRGTVSSGERELARRGVTLPNEGEIGRRAMIDHLGIPATSVAVLTTDVDNTAQEAEAIKRVVADRHWQRLIVITDRASTRRAGFAMRRVLGPNVEIIMRAPRTDPFPPSGWWRRRADFRTVFYELPKLLAYWAGLKG